MEYNADKLAKRITIARIRKGLQQSDVASHIHLGQSSYSRIESGKYNISVTQLCAISKFLDAPIPWLFGIDADPELTDPELFDLYDYKKYLIYKRNNSKQD